jgi:predicted ATPase
VFRHVRRRKRSTYRLWDEVWDEMAQPWERLTALQVKRVTRLGMHANGGGLYLYVQAGGGKSWVFRYMLNGRARGMGLGPAHAIRRVPEISASSG